MKYRCGHILFLTLAFVTFRREIRSQSISANTNSFYFKIHPFSQDVEEGKSVRLECAVRPNKNIVYWWQRDSQDVNMDDGRARLEGGSNLQILHADRDLDRGVYNCVAKNRSAPFTSMSDKASINVFWMAPNLTIQLLKPKMKSDIVIGSEVVLRCFVESSPPVRAANIKWFYNGVKLHPDMIVQGDGTLLIKKLKQSHAGTFHCRVFHTAGKLESRPPFVIVFAGNSSTPVDVSGISFVRYVKLNKNIQLVCPNVTGGGPNMMVFWGYMTQLGMPFKSLNDMPSVQPDLTNSLAVNIQNAKAAHANLYICDVRNSPTSINSQRFFIQVDIAAIYPLKRSQFSPQVENNRPYIVQKGNNFSLRFYVDLTAFNTYLMEGIPNPPPKIQWFNNQNGTVPEWQGSDVEMSPRQHALYGRHLIIRGAREEDTGVYRIQVSNLAGMETVSFSIVTTFYPKFSHNTPTKIEKDEDERILLKCPVAKRSPMGTSKITWKKDGVKISRLGGQIINTYKDKAELEIMSAMVINSGEYTCSIQTEGFERAHDSPLITVLVKGKLRFVHEIKSKFLEVGLQGRLPCKVQGFGEITTEWMRSQPPGSSGSLVPIQLPNQVERGTLIFQYVQKADAGTYVCVVRSSYKNREIQMTVEVAVGESPKIIRMSTNQTVCEGNQITLNCSASGDPTPEISWVQKNGLSLTSFVHNASGGGGRGAKAGGRTTSRDSRYRVLTNGSLVIGQVHLADEAMYFCVGSNSHTIQTRQGLYLRVLTRSEYEEQHQGDGINSSMIKTIVIVVSCAVAYLGLIIGLTIFCSLRMIRKRRKRAQNQLAKRENGHLMTQVNGGPPDQLLNHPLPPPTYHHHPHGYQTSVPTSRGTGGHHHQAHLLPGNGLEGGESQQLLSTDLAPPPPPTPMDSRSHLSCGTSSANSISMYSRSHLSGASAGGMGVSGPPASPIDRLHYPRHELQTEGMLGKGEFGDVFLARARHIQDRTSQSLVVVKALMSREPAHVHEFHRQLDMFAKLNHDYVAQLLGICSEMEPQFIILEYCDWGDLKQFLRCMRQERSNSRIPPLTPTQKITMCSQVAMGMEHLTNYRCVHKDLAARNVLLTQDMDLKISSLGLSRDVYANEYFPHRDRLVPLRWLAPEALIKDEYSAKSDVWSFGIFVLEVFSMAELPYCHTSDHELVQLAKKGTLKPDLPGKCPAELAALLERCFCEEAKDRPSFTEISVIMGDLTVDIDV